MDLIMTAWRPSTKKLYGTYIKKWLIFCVLGNIDPQGPTIPQACRFLRQLSDKGFSYAAINAARCALSMILPYNNGVSFGNNPIVCWLLKGCYEKNAPKPRYEQFWDVNKVFSLIKSWGKNKDLSLKKLSLKLAILLLLVSSQRGQTILNLSTENMKVGESVVFRMKILLKHNRLGEPLDTLEFKPFQPSSRLCVVRAIKAYLQRTSDFRGHDQLLLSFVRPHLPISRDTLSRWTVTVLKMAGMDVEQYKSHSTRGAATSAAYRLGVPLNLILKRASWKSESSFAKYYNKRLENEEERVGQALLQNA